MLGQEARQFANKLCEATVDMARMAPSDVDILAATMPKSRPDHIWGYFSEHSQHGLLVRNPLRARREVDGPIAGVGLELGMHGVGSVVVAATPPISAKASRP